MSGTRARRRDAVRLAVASGVLLALAGAPGSALLYLVALSLVAPLLPPAWLPVANALALALTLLAALGGGSVLLGAWALGRRRDVLGRTLVHVGAGMGALGLLLHALALAVDEGPTAAVTALATLHGAGVALAVAAGVRAPRVRVRGTRLRL